MSAIWTGLAAEELRAKNGRPSRRGQLGYGLSRKAGVLWALLLLVFSLGAASPVSAQVRHDADALR
jgi:hypothetical protein